MKIFINPGHGGNDCGLKTKISGWYDSYVCKYTDMSIEKLM